MTAPERLVAEIDAVFNCGRLTILGPCVLPAHSENERCQAMPPVVRFCPICRGRLVIPGTDIGCPCGDGMAP